MNEDIIEIIDDIDSVSPKKVVEVTEDNSVKRKISDVTYNTIEPETNELENNIVEDETTISLNPEEEAKKLREYLAIISQYEKHLFNTELYKITDFDLYAVVEYKNTN